jgi:hypothetical protein
MKHFQQTRPVRPGPPKISRAAAEVFSRLARTTRFADPGLAENWPSIAGGELAKLGRPGRVLGNGPGRTLEVIVRDGAAAAEMQMRADDLIQAVNRYLGPGAVARIALRQKSGSARPEPDEPRDGSPLSAALSSFRAAVKARKPRD